MTRLFAWGSMGRRDLIIVDAARALRRSAWKGYAAAAGIYLLATLAATLAQPAAREALFISYLPAVVFSTLVGGGYAGLLVAIAGGVSIWSWLMPLDNPDAALTLVLYVDAAALLLLVMEAMNRTIDTLQRERDGARVLFRELQHRTANNMMFVSGFLRMHRNQIRDDPQRAAPAIDEAMARLDSFARIHRHLTEPIQGDRSIGLLFRQLCDSLIAASGRRDVQVAMEIETAELPFEQLLVLSLLLAETVTNALKYAFPEDNGGSIGILLTSGARDHVFEIRDNGSALNEAAFNSRKQGIGHGIMAMLAAQLGGTLTWAIDGGLHTRIVFPRRMDAGWL
jgi:two-component system, sensor histidine kinase PdtaS